MNMHDTMRWLAGNPSQLPCFQTKWDASSFAWIDGKRIKMTAPLTPDGRWRSADDHIYSLHVVSTGADVDAYYITAQSFLPIEGYWIFRYFDMHDAIAIKYVANEPEFDFEIEWDDERPRNWDKSLALKVASAPLRIVE